MPNGGMMPNCFLCKWAEKDKDIHVAGDRIYCQRHSVVIVDSLATFCPDLAPHDERSALNSFIKHDNITGQDIYVWFDTPIGLMYHHEYVLLASLEVYRVWSEEQKWTAIRAIFNQKLKDFNKKSP